MKLIILGSGAAYPALGQASSGFLIEDGRNNFLIDCGTGVLSNLFRWTDPAKLIGIAITHLHTDHFIDIYPLRYYLQYTAKINDSIKVIAPLGGADHIARIISEPTHEYFFKIFSFQEINSEKSFEINGISLQFIPVKHTDSSFGVMVGKDRDLFYTGDTAYNEELIEKIIGVKTILSEATSQEKYGLMGQSHLTAFQAGLMAEQVGAKRLILTHIWPSFNKDESLREAARTFKGEIVLAEENKIFDL